MLSKNSQSWKVSIPMFHSVHEEFAKLVKVLVTPWHIESEWRVLRCLKFGEHLYQLLTLQQSQARNLVQVLKMFPSLGYILVFYLMISTGFSSSKPDNSKQSLAKTQAKQNFVVNNNCGLGQNERQTLSFIKKKVDEIATTIKSGKFLKWHKSPKNLNWYLVADISHIMHAVPFFLRLYGGSFL